MLSTAPITKGERILKLEKLGKVQEVLNAVDQERKHKATQGQAIQVIRVGSANS